MNDWLLAIDPLYPVITDPGFALLPIPAAYELLRKSQHPDGQDFRCVMIVGGNAVAGTLAYNYTSGKWFTYYLLGGTAYYTLFKSIIGSAPIAKGFPDTDP